jgi:hypothetical protein
MSEQSTTISDTPRTDKAREHVQDLIQCSEQLECELNYFKSINVRDGDWIDRGGACKVCDGEIPHGHTNECDIYKLECQVRQWKAMAEKFGDLAVHASSCRALKMEAMWSTCDCGLREATIEFQKLKGAK